MEFEIDYSDYAKADLADISEYLSNLYTNTLKRFIDAYDKRISLLSGNPFLYKVSEYNPNYRQVPVSDYVVFYKVTEKTKTTGIVEIYRILHSSRNIEILIK
jgi:addiction module RelE/StbE family toxin